MSKFSGGLMGKSMADELVEKLGANTNEGVISLAETFKRSKFREEKIDAAIAFVTINYKKYSQEAKDVVVDATRKGLRDKDDEICYICAEILSKEELINTEKLKVREKVVEELLFTCENRVDERERIRENVVLALGHIDYTDISTGTTKKALNLLAAAACDMDITRRELGAEGVNRRGDYETKKKVAEYWMPFLDTEYGGRVFGAPAFSEEEKFSRRTALQDIFSRLSWPPAAEHEILKFLKGEWKSSVDFEDNDIMTTIHKAGIDEQDLKDMVKAARKESVDIRASLHALGTVGSEKSSEFLKEWIEKNRNSTNSKIKEYVKVANEAVEKIERRVGVSAKPVDPEVKKLIKYLETDEVDFSYKQAITALAIKGEKAVEPLADVIKNSQFTLARVGAADAIGGDRDTFGMWLNSKERSRLKDVIVDAFTAGLSDKEKVVRDQCAEGLFTWLNSASPGIREKAIKKLISKYDEYAQISDLDKHWVVNDLRNADYTGISKETKREVLDFLTGMNKDKELGHLAKQAEETLKKSIGKEKVKVK